jgi:predicted RNA binding protein YcfA (HicA-like mRNA interferase family)
MPLKIREVIRMVESDGWVLVAQRGGHRQYKHPTKPGRVTISGNLGDDVKTGTLGSIKRQAGLK